jgi:hypothetical protein
LLDYQIVEIEQFGRMLVLMDQTLASQAEMKADINAKAQARHERILAFLDELKSCRRGMKTCQREAI